MKFVNAIYANGNLIKNLWRVIFYISVVSAILFSSTIYLAYRDPLIIERTCSSRVIENQSTTVTKKETENFINEALSARFDTERDKPSYLTVAQAEAKQKEIKELKSKNISQVVFVDQVDLKDNGEFRAILTRILKIGNIRTALGFEVTAKIYETRRTEDNPYGLILSEVKLVEKENRK